MRFCVYYMLALGIADDSDHPECNTYIYNEVPNNMCNFH